MWRGGGGREREREREIGEERGREGGREREKERRGELEGGAERERDSKGGIRQGKREYYYIKTLSIFYREQFSNSTLFNVLTRMLIWRCCL